MNVVFDFGGVLFRWRPAALLLRTWPHRLRDQASAEAAALAFFQNYGGDWGAFDQGLLDAQTVVQRISERTGWPASEVAAVVAAVPEELQALEGTVALIHELKAAGHRLFYLSNMPEPYADHLERAFPLSQWFEAGVFSGRVKYSKPGDDIYAIAEQRFAAAEPASLLFLDDHPANISAAKARGWQALLFSTAEAARADLTRLGLIR